MRAGDPHTLAGVPVRGCAHSSSGLCARVLGGCGALPAGQPWLVVPWVGAHTHTHTHRRAPAPCFPHTAAVCLFTVHLGAWAQENNDALLTILLSTLTKGTNACSDLVDKANIAFDRTSMKRTTKGMGSSMPSHMML